MKILFTGLYPRWQPHIIAEFNFMEEHIKAGDDVTLLTCDASLEVCDANPGRKLSECLACMGVRQGGIELLSRKIKTKPIIHKKIANRNKWQLKQKIKKLKNLENYTIDNLPVGKDILSSLISLTKNTLFEHKNNITLVIKAIKDYLNVYKTAEQLINEEKYDKVYIFNGRFIPAIAWIRACENNAIDYFTHERHLGPESVIKIKNGSPHDMSHYSESIRSFWEKHKTDDNIIREGIDFFEERPKGMSSGWFSYTSDQNQQSLPAGWDEQKRNIAIYSSTESEFAALKKYFSGALFTIQEDAYLEIACGVRKIDPSIHFYLRIHPNSKDEKNKWWEKSKLNNLDNVTIINPESTVSSYNLLRQSEKSIVFMSSMGVEATYWGKPSILLSNSFYKGINAVYEPQNLSEAIDFVTNYHLPPKSRDAALAYGSFMRCGGISLPFSRQINYHLTSFKNRILGAKTEVHKWQMRCESRKNRKHFYKIIRDLADKIYFRWIIFKLKGELRCYRDI